MSENKKSRRDFLKGSAMGVTVGTFATMGVFSYSPWRKNYFSKADRKQLDIGVCKSVKVTNISETSWFDNATLMHDIKMQADCWSTSMTTTGHRSETARDWETAPTMKPWPISSNSYPMTWKGRGHTLKRTASAWTTPEDTPP